MRVGRRGFLRAVAAAVVGAAVAPTITPIFTEPVVAGPVGDFVMYMTFYADMWVQNPRTCGVITGISAGE